MSGKTQARRIPATRHSPAERCFAALLKGALRQWQTCAGAGVALSADEDQFKPELALGAAAATGHCSNGANSGAATGVVLASQSAKRASSGVHYNGTQRRSILAAVAGANIYSRAGSFSPHYYRLPPLSACDEVSGAVNTAAGGCRREYASRTAVDNLATLNPWRLALRALF